MIKYITGDATSPIGEGNKLIIHISNNLQRWGAGFVLAISRKWSAPEVVYRSTPIKDLILGNVQIVQVEDDITVINMIAQHGTGFDVNGLAPIRYDALLACLRKVNDEALRIEATVHAPKFGSGLSGGNWNIIEELIKEAITVDVTIYEFK